MCVCGGRIGISEGCDRDRIAIYFSHKHLKQAQCCQDWLALGHTGLVLGLPAEVCFEDFTGEKESAGVANHAREACRGSFRHYLPQGLVRWPLRELCPRFAHSALTVSPSAGTPLGPWPHGVAGGCGCEWTGPAGS